MDAALAGLLTGLSLIVAIGAQNAYVLRLGLARQHVGLAVAICATSDVMLISLGISGVGRAIHLVPMLLSILRWIGVTYLVGYAVRSFWKASRPEVLLPSESVQPSALTSTSIPCSCLAPLGINTGRVGGGSRWGQGPGRSCGSPDSASVPDPRQA